MFKPTSKVTISVILIGLLYAFATGNLNGCIIPSVLIWLLVSFEVKPNV